MLIRFGCTRTVFLTETRAIKVAVCFGPLQPVLVVIREAYRGSLLAKLRKYKGNLTRIAIRSATLGGLDANRREARMYREHPEYPIAPVLRSYLWGFVIVMARGGCSGEGSTLRARSGTLPQRFREADIFYPENMGVFDGESKFLDYGDPGAEEILTALAISERP